MAEKKDKTKKKRTLLQKIVNIFLYFCLGVFILIVIALGITQTSMFRKYAKNTAVEQVNSALNGKLSIGRLDGSIFTSIILHDVTLTQSQDTMLHASKIEVRTSPLQLLAKKIFVRKLEIENADIHLIKDSTGRLNLSKLIPPSKPDTTSSSFPFKIEVPNFKLTNVNFYLQDYNKLNSKEKYDSLNLHDFRLKNLNLSLSASADINDNNYKIDFDGLSAEPNLKHFTLNDLTGEISVNKKEIAVNNFNLQTAQSDIKIDLQANNFNMFDSTSRLSDANLNVDLNADKLDFDNLSSFVPSMNMLKGKATAKLNVEGTFNKLNIKNLEVILDNSHIGAKGNITDLDKPKSIYISANFYDSYIDQNDVNTLLPSLNIPTYKQYGVLRFDTLTYKGKPQDFRTNLYVKTDAGGFGANGKLNFQNSTMQYNLNFVTNSLNIAPIASIQSNLNSRGKVTGKGTSPKNLNARFNFIADGSTLDGNKLDTLRLTADAKSKKITYTLNVNSDTANADLAGNFNFTNENNPAYEIKGSVKSLDLASFTKGEGVKTDLNFNIDASGENFDLNKMNLFASLKIINSEVNGVHIDSTRAIADIRKNDGGERIINLISDLADITLSGNFSIAQSINLVTSEAGLISKVVDEKMHELIPNDSSGAAKTASLRMNGKNKKAVPLFAEADSSTTLKYTVEFKDFSLLTVFLGNNQLELDGDINGEITNSRDSLYITYNANLDYVKYWGANDVFFLSKLNLNLLLSNSFQANSLEDITTKVKLRTDRIFTGSDIHKVALDLILQNKKADINFSGNLADYAAAQLTGQINLEGSELNLALDTLAFRYNNFRMRNREKISIDYSLDRVRIKDFVLERNNSIISIDGELLKSGNQNLNIMLKNIRGRDISRNFFEFRPENSPEASINLKANIKGNFGAPVIDLALDVDSVSFKNKNFGNLKTQLNYKNENLAIDLKFIDSLITASKPALTLKGNAPINLAFSGVTERFPKNKNINLKLNAEDFNLGAFGDMLPAVDRLRGNFKADLDITGPIDDLNPKGNIVIQNAAFVAQANNLEYYAGLKLSIQNETLSIDSLLVQNSKGTENGGTMTGSGKATLNNFKIASSKFQIGGHLKVLGQASKNVSPSVYGDLVISTRGNVEFKIDNNGAYLQAPINVDEAKLTFPPTQSAYQNNSSNFVYKYVQDTLNPVQKEMDFQSLVELSQQRSEKENSTSGSGSSFNFNYNIDVQVSDEATIIFVLSREVNQNLTAVLKGNFQYEKINGRTNAQGELKLLEGSNLEFFKTFSADGTIRFESELNNPNLDITATYKDYYYPPENESEVQVAVKIKLSGPLKELDKNFIQEKNNIAVYYGQNDIENDNPSPTYDASDAIMFILTGKFTEDLSQQEKSTAASKLGPLSGTATSLAGSVLGGVLNTYLGDYVKSVELRTVGSSTKFNLTGRVKDFRYTIGGSTDVFNDITQANVKIEYPIFQNFLLRLERKEALTETNITNNEMINELGLKYRFEF